MGISGGRFPARGRSRIDLQIQAPHRRCLDWHIHDAAHAFPFRADSGSYSRSLSDDGRDQLCCRYPDVRRRRVPRGRRRFSARDNGETMTQAELEAFVAELANVEREENFGYSFFFVGGDHRLPFVTFANSDHDYDNVSNLNRDGVFRVNIGVGKDTFSNLFADLGSEPIDYTALNVFLPHPDYARQHFICILNPSGVNIEKTKQCILEAHSLAA